MGKRFITIVCLMVVFVALASSTQPAYTQSQTSDCPALVQQALDAVGNSCGGLGRNNACYGFNRVNATFSANVSDDTFSKPSDKTSLKTIQSIETAPLDEALKEWGVAVMSVQANIPDTIPGQAVSFILLGDTKVDNAVPADQAVTPAANPIDLTTISQSNIRTLPTTNSNIVGSVDGGSSLKADAINSTKDWLRVVYKDAAPGWISRALVKSSGDLDSLPVFTADSETPMQAFYFRSGVGAPNCNKAPDALVVQGPDKIGVDITANGAKVHIGSTVVFRTLDNNQMQVFTIHGEATVNGVHVPIGFVTTVQLSDDGKSVVGAPSAPRPITQEDLDGLQWLEGIPSDVLNYPITVPNFQYVPPTAVPSNNTTNNTPNNPNTKAVDCTKFKATSPLDGLNYGMNSFYWDPAPGATSYRVNVQSAGSKDIDAPTTTANFDISSAGFNPQLTWSVDALYNGVVVCSTAPVTIPRQWAPPPPPSKPQAPSFSASWQCGSGFDFVVQYGGLPSGTTSVTINFDSDGAEFDPDSPITVPVPPNSGRVDVEVFSEGGWRLFGGSVTASPSGAMVALPDIDCSPFSN